MHVFPRICLVLVMASVLGCAPRVMYRIETEIAPGGCCRRKVAIQASPSPRMPNQRVKLRDYLDFADAELYENFVLLQDKAMFSGTFASPLKVPPDFIKRTPPLERRAMNRIRFRQIDLVLLEVMEYEERISDIVDRAEGEKALDEVGELLLNAAIQTLRDRYGAKYDLSRIEVWLKKHMPEVLRRLYAAMWEIRRARRGGVRFLTESDEWKLCLLREFQRIDPKAPSSSADSKELRGALTNFLDRKLQELVVPRRPDIPPLTAEAFRDRSGRMALFDALQESVKKQYGSFPEFTKRVEALLPRAFGAFLISQASLMPVNPKFEWQVRLRMPGHVVQTNGLRDMDGRILWSIPDNEVALSGYGMWARSLAVRADALAALGLKRFPDHIHSVERLFQHLKNPRGNELSRELVVALQKSVEAGSFAPLEAMTEADKPTPLAQAAANLLAFLQAYRDDSSAPSQPVEEPFPGPDLPPATPGTDSILPDVEEKPAIIPAPDPKSDTPAPENANPGPEMPDLDR